MYVIYTPSNYYECKDFHTEYFYNFIDSMKSNSLYMITPLILINNNKDKPYIVLSKSILISKYSSYKLIEEYLNLKYKEFLNDFNINELEEFYLILKYKKVYFDINKKKTKLK